MGRNDNNRWDRGRDEQERDWGRNQDVQQRRQRPRGADYGSTAGWGGQGFSQGSFGRFGGQGERLYTQHGGQGFGAESGYSGRGYGGGMSSYANESRGNERYESRGNERYESRAEPDWNQEHQRESQNREWRGQDFSGREGGWGGYGGYDREHHGSQGGAYEGSRGYSNPNTSFDRSSYDQGSYEGTFGGYGGQSGWQGSYGQASYGNTGSSNMGYGSSSRSHAGKGPKGYQRGDDRIREDVNEQLTRHHGVDASEVEVEVQGGEVTLKGKVDSRHEKRMAEDIAEQVSGVRQVHNQIRVEQRQVETSQNWGSPQAGPFAGSNISSSSQQREPAGTTHRSKP